MSYNDKRNELLQSYDDGDCTFDEVEAYRRGYQDCEKEMGWKRAGSSDDNVDGKEVLIRYWVEFDRDPIKRRYKKQKATWHNYNKIWIGDVTTLPHRKVTHIMEIPEVEE